MKGGKNKELISSEFLSGNKKGWAATTICCSQTSSDFLCDLSHKMKKVKKKTKKTMIGLDNLDLKAQSVNVIFVADF
jgi:hypothetical protein